MAYRSDTDALEARLDVLTKDLADRTRERDEVARMLAEARDRDAAQRWLEERPRRRRRLLIAGLAAAVMMLGGIVTFFVVRHDSLRERDEQVLRDLEQFTDDMCQCTESKCVTAISNRMNEWAQRMAEDYGPGRKLDEELVKRTATIAERMGKCMTKAMSANDPTVEQTNPSSATK
jgi:hypothetical protein